MLRAILLILAPLCLLQISVLFSAEESAPKADEQDYRSELPRIAPKSPQEALKTFRLRPGFKIELVAAEPVVRDPVSISFDENGNAYVAELPKYNRYEFEGFGTVKLLSDRDRNGTLEQATVFLDDVKYPTAVFAYGGGVFVADPPDVLFCKDTNGDGRADVRKVVMTGFGLDHAGEAGLNSFRWGMDNRIHISLSLAGGQVTAAATPDAKPVEVRGRGMVFDPRSGTFELTTGAGQHGMTLDDWGRKFVCSNSNPMQTLMYDGRYVARNPYLAPPPAAVTIAPDGKFTKLFRTSTIEPWRNVRTRLRSQGIVKGSDEGGKPGGFFTAATGITVYRGDAWPNGYRGNLLVGEVSNNLIYRATVEPDGVGVIGRRADPGVEFLSSSDNWFRPVQLANAPDGSLYVLDMYRELIEGAAFIPPAILKHLDVASGVDRGRIYRIVAEGFKQPPPSELGNASVQELVVALESPNGWRRDTASRLIYQRQDRAAASPLRKLAASSKLPLTRAHALHSLQGLDALEPDDVLRGLQDTHAQVRIQALRLSEQFAQESPRVRTAIYNAARDSDRLVRYQAAFSVGACPDSRRDAVLAEIVRSDGSDPWFRLAVQTSLGDGAAALIAELLSDEAYRGTEAGRRFLTQLAGQVGAQNRESELALLLSSVQSLPAGENKLAQSLIGGVLGKVNAQTRGKLTGARNGKVSELLAGLLEQARQTAGDPKAKIAARTDAIRTLSLSKFADVSELFGALLQVQQPPRVQLAVLQALVQFDQPEVATLIIDAWPNWGPQVRARAAETLSARTVWIGALLDAIADERIRATDLGQARIQLLTSHKDSQLRQRAKSLFAAVTPARRDEVVKAYQPALSLTGDVERGRQFFRKNCTSCHRLEKVGTALGADLKAIKDRGNAAILLNILDPNREVKPQFVGYVLITDRGRTMTGMITDESANSVTLKRADGTSDTVLRVNIDELTSSGRSFMPEGLEKQINHQQMADLLAYLNAVK